MIANTDWSLTK